MNKFIENISPHFKIAILIVFLISCKENSNNSLEDHVNNLNLEFDKNKFFSMSIDYDSAIFEKSDVILYSKEYFEKKYSVDLNINLLLLSRNDFNQLQTKNKSIYGLIYYEDDFLILPIEKKGIAFKFMDLYMPQAVDSCKRKTNNSSLYSNNDPTMLLTHLMGVHYLTKLTQYNLHLPDTPKWKVDFIGDIMQIEFLDIYFPQYNSLLEEFCKIAVKELKPIYKTLDEFERRYDFDPVSYSVYESKLHLQALEAYKKYGVSLLDDYFKNHNLVYFDTIKLSFN